MSRCKLRRAWSDLADEMRGAAFNDQADVSLLSSEELEEAAQVVDLDDALDIAHKHLTALALGPFDRLRSTLPWSRPCYDKSHRCPGWVGGGFTSAMVKRCPEGGSLGRIDYRRRYWRGAHCPECGLYVLPIFTRLADPVWIWWRIRHPRWPYWASVRYWRYRARRVFRKGK